MKNYSKTISISRCGFCNPQSVSLPMPDQEEINQQQELLRAHRRTLGHYLVQQAQLGGAFAPPGVTQGIYEEREQIQRIKGILRGWRVRVVNHPDDEPPGSAIDEMELSKAKCSDYRAAAQRKDLTAALSSADHHYATGATAFRPAQRLAAGAGAIS
jgi:hypothetical protein